jgi:hypothetical protein
MMRLLNRVLAFFRRRRQPAYYAQQQSLLQGTPGRVPLSSTLRSLLLREAQPS